MGRCGMCGSKDLDLRSAKGDIFPYKGLDVKLTHDTMLRTCLQCGNRIVTSADIVKLDEVLEHDYRRMRREAKLS